MKIEMPPFQESIFIQSYVTQKVEAKFVEFKK